LRKAINDLIKKVFTLKYKLPNGSIEKSSITGQYDYCYEATDSGISDSIYMSIIDYCLNDIEIDLTKLDQNQIFSVENRLRYNSEDELDVQVKYGFFGEVLLNIVLSVFFHTNKIIAKGHFYSPIEKSEPKGYDSFHFVEDGGKIEFWFGEVKMYSSIRQAINSINSNLNKALSTDYYKENLRAILMRNNDLDEPGSSQLFKDLLDQLRNSNMNKVIDEIKSKGIKVVYPILIVYNENSSTFDEKIMKSMKIITDKIDTNKVINELSAEILFILIPANDVIEIKKEVLEWIFSQKSII
jgi:hypothetical protein